MGKAEFLHRLAAELSTTPAVDSPHVIRFNASSLPSATTDITRNHHQIVDSVDSDTLVVMLVDNIDLVDANTREVILELAAGQSPRVVLFATAQESSIAALDYRPLEIRTLPPVTTAQTLDLLVHGHQRETSPQVAAILNRSLCGNPGMIVETALQLRPEQLAGNAELPDPLPPTPLVEEVVGASVAALDSTGRQILLLAALSVTDQTRLLCTAAHIDVDTFIRSDVCSLLTLNSGRFEISDPRVRAYVSAHASVSERTEAHHRLADALANEAGDEFSVWHRSVAAVEGHAALTKDLVTLSKRIFLRGDAVWAHEIAREAASHAPAHLTQSVEFLAGLTALHSGFVDDAVDWLNGVMRCDDTGWAAKALAPFIVSVTYARGYVPIDEVLKFVEQLQQQRPTATDSTDERLRSDVVAGLILAAGLSAERGNHTAARQLLERGEELGKGIRESVWLVAVARQWCAAFGLDPQEDRNIGTAPLALDGYAVLAGALGFAGNGEWAASSNLLSSSLLAFAPARRQAGRAGALAYAATPLLEAHLRVALALSEASLGHVVRAKTLLEDAAYDLPVRLPFAGLGVAALGRYSTLVDGTASTAGTALSQLLSHVDPSALHRENLVNEAIVASSANEVCEAAALMNLVCSNRAGSQLSAFELPAPDEPQLWLAAGNPAAAREALTRQPIDTATQRATNIRGLLAIATCDDLPHLLVQARRISHEQASSFEQARIEWEIATAYLRLGDEHRARVHRLTAADLALPSGAMSSIHALQRDHTSLYPAVDLLPARHRAEHATTRQPQRHITAVPPPTTLSRDEPHPEWMNTLTHREQQIAALVVEGLTNREAAHELHLSVRTIETHLGRIFAKVGVRSRTQLGHLSRQNPRRRAGSATT
ncbi:LuxR family transcriptional regulator [Salinibacterium sp. NK8237]|uniref:LuxR family transcriptional regulator n=1 Tax=Salinibacterium sp. NK8237 TaxID=2792038 RepID=UPI0018CC98F4|nr:LuxR family transcriptional regulator [Salinibacterium sp. NK8237]MBH0130348.1 hypothetical protein [Salinibacterium sp. NK8237]